MKLTVCKDNGSPKVPGEGCRTATVEQGPLHSARVVSNHAPLANAGRIPHTSERLVVQRLSVDMVCVQSLDQRLLLILHVLVGPSRSCIGTENMLSVSSDFRGLIKMFRGGMASRQR